MNARRYLTLLAALLITLGQALIMAADTAARAAPAVASVARHGEASAGPSHA